MRPLIRPSQFSLKSIRSAVQMSRRERSLSTPSSPREAKRPRLEVPLTSEDYKNGIMLAPMVRSGACKFLTPPSLLFGVCSCLVYEVPTRLFSLKYGASLVWGPEIVDKAILHAERVVDRTSRSLPSDLPPSIPFSFIRWLISAAVSSCDRSRELQRKIQSHLVNPSHRKTLPHLPNRLRRSRARRKSGQGRHERCLGH